MTTIPESLKGCLDQQALLFNHTSFIPSDPISVPHSFQNKEDIEIAGFLAATIAWGQRSAIIPSALRLTGLMGGEPYNFLAKSSSYEFDRFTGFVYRTFNGDDCLFFMEALRRIYLEHGSMEPLFLEGYEKDHSIKEGIVSFRRNFLQTPHLARSEKHLADPAKGSSAKRLNLFLRWMVRADQTGVDFGLWKSISPAHLMCPLDVHSGRTARKLGLLARQQNDWKAVEELTTALRRMDPHDPVKYDFALFGAGISRENSGSKS